MNEFGVITETPGDLTAHTWNDLVSFYVGCSFGFEGKLVQAGIPLKNITEKHGDGASMFETNLHCISVGPFASPLIVSMRAIPKDLVEKTLIITAAFEGLHEHQYTLEIQQSLEYMIFTTKSLVNLQTLEILYPCFGPVADQGP